MACLLLSCLGNGLVFPFTAIYVSELLGLGSGAASGYFVAMAAASFVAALLGGPLADRRGPHRVGALGAAALGVGYASMAPADAAALVMVSGACVGVGFGLFYASIVGVVDDAVPFEGRRKAFTVRHIVNNVGIGLGSVIAGVALQGGDTPTGVLRWLYAANAVAAVPMVLLVWRTRPRLTNDGNVVPTTDPTPDSSAGETPGSSAGLAADDEPAGTPVTSTATQALAPEYRRTGSDVSASPDSGQPAEERNAERSDVGAATAPAPDAASEPAVTYRLLLRRGPMALLIVAQALFAIVGFTQIEATVPLLMHDHMAVTLGWVSIVVAANSFALVALQPLVSPWFERLPETVSLAIGPVLWIAAFGTGWVAALCDGAATRYTLLLVFAVLFAVGELTYSSAFYPLLLHWSGEAAVGRASALASLAWNVGTASGPPIGLFVIGHASAVGSWGALASGAALAFLVAASLHRRAARA